MVHDIPELRRDRGVPVVPALRAALVLVLRPQCRVGVDDALDATDKPVVLRMEDAQRPNTICLLSEPDMTAPSSRWTTCMTSSHELPDVTLAANSSDADLNNF